MKGDDCSCIALNHDHKPAECHNPEPVTGKGVCDHCRYYHSPPRKGKA